MSHALAVQVADELMTHDALGAHARDELGILEMHRARPLQAALASAAAFSVGGILPVLLVLFTPEAYVAVMVVAASLVSLLLLGILSARVGGAPTGKAALRVTFWGALAMVITYGVGALIGAPL